MVLSMVLNQGTSGVLPDILQGLLALTDDYSKNHCSPAQQTLHLFKSHRLTM